jgi:multidrug efflux pump subunit AcrA (membrane-fusion protein)
MLRTVVKLIFLITPNLWLSFLLLTGCRQAGRAQAEATPTPLPTPVVPETPRYRVGRGTVVQALQLTGRVSPVAEQALFFRSDGFVDEVYVQRGETVQAGDLLAQLDNGALEAELAQAQLAQRRAGAVLAQAEQDHVDARARAQLELEQAQVALQRAQAGAGSAATTRGEINVARAEEALAYWQEEYQKALDRPWEPQEVVDNYARQVQQAQDNLEIARAEYNAAVGARSATYQSVRLGEIDVQLAELRLQELARGVDPLLALDVEKARLQVAELENQIAAAQLRAPFAGQVATLRITAGDAVQAYEPVAVVADSQRLEVTAAVNLAALQQLSEGMTATIRLRNRPSQALAGRVRQLPLTPLDGNAGDERLHVAFVPREMASPAGTLQIGELATVTILLQEKQDVLWLPPAALRTFQGRDFVVVETAEGRRRVDVRLGIAGDGRVEIVAGLEEGQIVIAE